MRCIDIVAVRVEHKLVPMKVLGRDSAAQTLDVVAVSEKKEGANEWRVRAVRSQCAPNSVFGGCVSVNVFEETFTFASGMMMKAARVLAATLATEEAERAAAAAAPAAAKRARSETENEMRGTVEAESAARRRTGTTSRGRGGVVDSHEKVCPRVGLSGACVPAFFFCCSCKKPTD